MCIKSIIFVGHEAVASEVRLGISTFKPSEYPKGKSLSSFYDMHTWYNVHSCCMHNNMFILHPYAAYVWSLDLIPLFARLNQTLDGLFRITSSALSFAIVQVRSGSETLSSYSLAAINTDISECWDEP
jgi:hypothetical protein